MPGVGRQRRAELEEVGGAGEGSWPFWEQEGKVAHPGKAEGPAWVREEGRAVDKGVET